MIPSGLTIPDRGAREQAAAAASKAAEAAPSTTAALKRLRDAKVSDLAPHEIAAVVVVALMIVVIIVGLLVWISR